MKRIVFLLSISLVLPAIGCKSNSPAGPESAVGNRPSEGPQNAAIGSGFDFYLLNLSWSPEFCHGHPDAAECAARSTFVLHGLWPQNSNGSYPEKCSNAPGPPNPAQYADIYPDASLLQHEWQTHGTCSGLSADAFFQDARSAFRSINIPPAFTTLGSQISLPPERIVSLFAASNSSLPAGSLLVSCGNNYLTAVEICMDKSLHPIACSGIRSCRANTVRIPAP